MMLRRILRHRRRTVAPQPVSQPILPNKPDNARAALNSFANAPSTSVRGYTATAGSPVKNACLADSGASLAPPLTLILVLASLILRIGFAAAYAVLLVTAWVVIPIRIGAEPTGVDAEFRHQPGISIAGGLLAGQALVLLTAPMIYLSFDRLQQRCFKLEVRDADLGSPME
jgi:hypothetical protein